MMNLNELKRKVKEINLPKAFDEFAKDNPTIFLDAMREQLYSGKNKKGFGIPYRSTSYEKMKREMNPGAGGMTDFFLTGKFYEGLQLNVENGLQFTSNVEYADKLFLGKYSDSWGYNENTKIKEKILKNGFKNYII